ncbi:uncharacterized protein G2W53_031689 [Senna tora]|uniref:Uncharacterized protein n=1 Tax=Senna tora TaxID=362788 RepID=A0A834SUC9_9FABA|nr:uncharacterized protein G2W53_031689 [Senna tora]
MAGTDKQGNDALATKESLA